MNMFLGMPDFHVKIEKSSTKFPNSIHRFHSDSKNFLLRAWKKVRKITQFVSAYLLKHFSGNHSWYSIATSHMQIVFIPLHEFGKYHSLADSHCMPHYKRHRISFHFMFIPPTFTKRFLARTPYTIIKFGSMAAEVQVYTIAVWLCSCSLGVIN